MRNSKDNVARYLAKGVPSAINADDYDYNELVQLAEVAGACNVELTVCPSAKTLTNGIDDMVSKGKGFIRLDWRTWH